MFWSFFILVGAHLANFKKKFIKDVSLFLTIKLQPFDYLLLGYLRR